MLKPSIIMSISDLEDAITDYRFGFYSDEEFTNVLLKKTRAIEATLNALTAINNFQRQISVIEESFEPTPQQENQYDAWKENHD